MSGGTVLALCGGVGGGKLARGLAAQLGHDLVVAINTGDDFEHLGLHVSPDIDTVTYAIAGLDDSVRGWGRADETWNFMEALLAVGGETWFALGDRDLALHVERTRRLRSGDTLSFITGDFSRALGVEARLVPMSDDPVSTIVHTVDGELPFQRYFVEQRCRPAVTAFSYRGASVARPALAFLEAFDDPYLEAIVICPSNPYLSIDPMLTLPGIREALLDRRVPAVAVSPIIAGAAVKGPTTKIMSELSLALEQRTIEEHYAGLLDGLVIDCSDRHEATALRSRVCVAPTLMNTDQDKRALAAEVLAFARSLAKPVNPLT